jgi:hypothetical protein
MGFRRSYSFKLERMKMMICIFIDTPPYPSGKPWHIGAVLIMLK